VLTPEQKYHVRKSLGLVERQAHVAALVFYQKLFELDPLLRPLFKADIEVQAVKLMDTLAAVLSFLEKPEQLVDLFEEMGGRYSEYGVRQEHYRTVGAALHSMLANVLGRNFTPETREAWSALYKFAVRKMAKGAQKLV
jgi:hemoglobin-like flavoprotein